MKTYLEEDAVEISISGEELLTAMFEEGKDFDTIVVQLLEAINKDPDETIEDLCTASRHQQKEKLLILRITP